MRLPIQTYDDALKYVFQKELVSGTKYNLDNISQAREMLEFPDTSYKIIHVAGTNGK
jgi:folylpolyglutamate synthase/dihydropteroate synthase